MRVWAGVALVCCRALSGASRPPWQAVPTAIATWEQPGVHALRKRLGKAVAGNTPTASQLTKIGKMQSAWCRVCSGPREARCESNYNLAFETYSHINSADCEGVATTVTTAHHDHAIWRHLYTVVTACTLHKTQKARSILSRLTKKNMSTLWRRQGFWRICSEEDRDLVPVEKAREIEVTTPKKVKQIVTTSIQYPFHYGAHDWIWYSQI